MEDDDLSMCAVCACIVCTYMWATSNNTQFCRVWYDKIQSALPQYFPFNTLAFSPIAGVNHWPLSSTSNNIYISYVYIYTIIRTFSTSKEKSYHTEFFFFLFFWIGFGIWLMACMCVCVPHKSNKEVTNGKLIAFFHGHIIFLPFVLTLTLLLLRLLQPPCYSL